MFKEVYDKLNHKIKKSLELLQQNFATIRTGRANPGLVNNINIEYYGTNTPLNQVANITIPEINLVLIHPWDKSILSNIEKAILKSNTGLVPMNDGKIIRINIPHLNEERRKELVKLVKKISEETKVIIRNLRREANEEIKKIEKQNKVPEDEVKKNQEEIQKITEKYIEEVNKYLLHKEKEILEV